MFATCFLPGGKLRVRKQDRTVLPRTRDQGPGTWAQGPGSRTQGPGLVPFPTHYQHSRQRNCPSRKLNFTHRGHDAGSADTVTCPGLGTLGPIWFMATHSTSSSLFIITACCLFWTLSSVLFVRITKICCNAALYSQVQELSENTPLKLQQIPRCQHGDVKNPKIFNQPS